MLRVMAKTLANTLKKEGFKLARKTVKQKQAEQHNLLLEQTRNLEWENIYTASFKDATVEYSKAQEEFCKGTREKKPSARTACKKLQSERT
jgi:hypothetical protein